MIRTIYNPDPRQIYHTWHYCRVCGATFDHSQGSWDYGVKPHLRQHGDDCIAGVSTDVPSVTIELEDASA